MDDGLLYLEVCLIGGLWSCLRMLKEQLGTFLQRLKNDEKALAAKYKG